MELYDETKPLVLEKTVAVTKEVHDILKKTTRGKNISMAKLVCNLIIERYGND